MVDRAKRIIAKHPMCVQEVPGELPSVEVHVYGRRAEFVLIRSSGPQPVARVEYDPVVPGSAARRFAETFQGLLDGLVQEAVEQVAQLLRAIERFAHDLRVALDDNERLRAELERARIDVEFLRRQVDNLTEALKTGRPGITKAMLAAVGAILLAVLTGTAEGGSGAMVDRVFEAPAEAVQYFARCEDLTRQMDAAEFEDDRFPRP